MDITVETITPSVAKKMLASNTGNRPLDKHVCARYEAELRSGKWDNDGSPIRFAKNGRLLDGQHRLNAIVNSGVTLEAVVIRGLHDDAFKTMDTGKKRTASDLLGVKGYKNASAAAAIASSYYYYTVTGHPGNLGGAGKITNQKALDVYESNPEIEEAAAFMEGHSWIKRHMFSMSFGPLYVAACKAGERHLVRSFFGELCSPTTLAIGTSVIPLRDRLIENKASREKMSREMITALTFKAYRDFRARRIVKLLKVVLKDGRLTKDHFKLN